MIADGRFALLKTTLLDFPGRVAAAVFLPGCHLKCPYCHNPELVDPEAAGEAEFNCSVGELDVFLGQRSRLLGGLAVSGGEALLHPLLVSVLNLAGKYQLPVKLDTAGLLPEKLERLLAERRQQIAYVAVDLKTRPDRYGELGWPASSPPADFLINRTMDVLESAGVDYELRTTVVPPLVTRESLAALYGFASRAPRWIWQSYHPGNTLNRDWADLRAPDEVNLAAWAEDLNKNSGAPETPLISVR